MNKLCILFCDLDGVVNSETFYTKRANGKYDDKPYPLSEFDPEAVVQVNRIIEETGTKLVISSSWRFTEGLRNIMEQVGFSEKCLDFEITPYLGTIRGLEIKKYIEEYPNKHNGDEIETYCIVDDDIDMLYEQKDNFVKTDAYYGGLTKEKADEVIRILNNDGFVQHERINVDTGYQELLSVKNGDDCSSICVFKMEPKEIININNEEVFRTIEVTVKELYGYLENKPLPFKMKYDNEGYLQVSVKVKQSTEGNRDIFKKVLTGELFDKPWRYINISYLKSIMFTENDKGSFKYWFAHWCAFNMVALNLGCWKFKYLFHDIDKPFLNLFMSYQKVKEWHRNHSKHHIESYYYYLKRQFKDMDWQAMVIDWECSRFTKENAQLNARETLEKICKRYENIDEMFAKKLKIMIEYELNKLGL